MIKPFTHYLNEHLVRKSTPNPSMAKSLLQKAEIRLTRLSNEKIEEQNASIFFEEIYETIREASQSLMELNGYKPYSHEALVSFLKENKLLSEEETNVIDTYRILRNNFVYKAEKVSMEKCTEALKFLKKVLPEITVVFTTIVKTDAQTPKEPKKEDKEKIEK